MANFILDMAAVLAALVLIWAALSVLTMASALADDNAPDVCAVANSIAEADQEWRFRVFLDKKEIGCHYYFLDEREDHRLVHSIANFEYKLLFVKLYDYEHENNEIWDGNCLTRIQSNTDANGTPFAVDGRQQGNRFVVAGNTNETSLPSCIMSFAYWNPEFLEASHLLNTQNGEYLEVFFEEPVAELINVDGEQWQSRRYRLSAGELTMDLWYSTDGQWLSLQTEARAGHMLRYERMFAQNTPLARSAP